MTDGRITMTTKPPCLQVICGCGRICLRVSHGASVDLSIKALTCICGNIIEIPMTTDGWEDIGTKETVAKQVQTLDKKSN